MKLKVAEVLNRWPAVEASFRPATVRHLLTHTAGIRECCTPPACSGGRTSARA